MQPSYLLYGLLRSPSYCEASGFALALRALDKALPYPLACGAGKAYGFALRVALRLPGDKATLYPLGKAFSLTVRQSNCFAGRPEASL